MANNITNRLRFDQCSTERCREILEAIQIENIGFGSIDFKKSFPNHPSHPIKIASIGVLKIGIPNGMPTDTRTALSTMKTRTKSAF